MSPAQMFSIAELSCEVKRTGAQIMPTVQPLHITLKGRANLNLKTKLLTMAEAKKRKSDADTQRRKHQRLMQAEQPEAIE